MILYDEGGNESKWVYPQKRNLNFKNPKDLKELQKWRLQIIKRKLNQNNDGQSQKTDFRPHWCHEEKDFLQYKVLEAIKSNKRILNKRDWDEVAKEFNKRFKGYTIPGECSSSSTRKEIIQYFTNFVSFQQSVRVFHLT